MPFSHLPKNNCSCRDEILFLLRCLLPPNTTPLTLCISLGALILIEIGEDQNHVGFLEMYLALLAPLSPKCLEVTQINQKRALLFGNKCVHVGNYSSIIINSKFPYVDKS